MRDLLFLMKRFGFGAATLQNSGLHFLIARSIDLHIIRGVIRASSRTASLHSLHKPKGSCFFTVVSAGKKCVILNFRLTDTVCGFIPVVMEIYGEEETLYIDRIVERGQYAPLELKQTCHTKYVQQMAVLSLFSLLQGNVRWWFSLDTSDYGVQRHSLKGNASFIKGII